MKAKNVLTTKRKKCNCGCPKCDQETNMKVRDVFAKKVGKVMGEYKEGKLRSGSKKGPQVKSRQQAIAIGLSEARKAQK